MKTMILSSVVALTAGAATAGGPTANYVEPDVIAPAPVAVAATGDWTGPYLGLSFGSVVADANNNIETGGNYGVYGGYDYDFGSFVLGGELEYQALDDMTVGGIDVESMAKLKARAGFDLGQTLVYFTAGAAQADTSLGDATGALGGVGLDYRVTDRFSVGGEYLAHRFEDVGNTGVDLDAQTVTLRGSLRF